MSVLLEVRDLHYYYGNIHVVKGINLKVEKGEIVTLIGANGAGKTTTLRTISGLTPSEGVRGEIYFKGNPIHKVPGHKIVRLGLSQVLEGRHIFSQLTVYENLMMGAYTRNNTKKVKEELEEIYDLFPRLEERKNQLGGTLSGGEQQMLAIARAMLADPELLLLDEPSLGLAPIIVEEIFEAIKKIRDRGTSILLVEQNAKKALTTADRGYVMRVGEIILENTCAALFENEEVQRVYLGVS